MIQLVKPRVGFCQYDPTLHAFFPPWQVVGKQLAGLFSLEMCFPDHTAFLNIWIFCQHYNLEDITSNIRLLAFKKISGRNIFSHSNHWPSWIMAMDPFQETLSSPGFRIPTYYLIYILYLILLGIWVCSALGHATAPLFFLVSERKPSAMWRRREQRLWKPQIRLLHSSQPYYSPGKGAPRNSRGSKKNELILFGLSQAPPFPIMYSSFVLHFFFLNHRV